MDDICHYCLSHSESFKITGFTKTKNGNFLSYRLCQECSQKLFSINNYSDKNGRALFLNAVKVNAKSLDSYVDAVL
jgi:hypothetical protein